MLDRAINGKQFKINFNVRKRITISTALVLLIMIGSGLFIDAENLTVNMEIKNQSPSLTHLFGTDWLGRDMLMRTLKGLTFSFGVGILAALDRKSTRLNSSHV